MNLRQGIVRLHPPFVSSVIADARVTAHCRGERSEFRSRPDALLQAARLAFVTDAFLAQCCYRAQARLFALGVPILPHLFHHLAISLGGVCIGEPVIVGPGAYLPHGQVVIDGVTRIGSFSVIGGSVTVGLVAGDLTGPTMGHHVTIAPGAKVLGPVTIGDRARVGANAVVLQDVAAGTSVEGVPARPNPSGAPAEGALAGGYHPAAP